ncbi:DUF6660 family protein [Dyadobacter tibetensis]|uniref:DUF6660 family protein n=1 Tax=Dyadobacter tibetensis TaxID=1211851 RepID=UPI000470DF95|nr:DUF6660 family protein [Dyadobacter tibetensis]
MSKLIHYLLVLYTLALSAVPCNDAWARVSDTAVLESVVSDLPGSHQDRADHCSVFCSCTCCASITSGQYSLAIPTIAVKEYYYKAQFWAAENFYGTDRGKIWQPPQI